MLEKDNCDNIFTIVIVLWIFNGHGFVLILQMWSHGDFMNVVLYAVDCSPSVP